MLDGQPDETLGGEGEHAGRSAGRRQGDGEEGHDHVTVMWTGHCDMCDGV